MREMSEAAAKDRTATAAFRVDATFVGLLSLAAAKLAVHVIANRQYGFHRDELATLDDARHLAWGYVAYPPLTPFFGRIELTLFGRSLTGFRLFAAIAQCVAILVSAQMARVMGGNRRAQWLAALATLIAPISLAASSLFQYVSFDYLWWVLIAFFLLLRIARDDERWWLGIGAAIGLGVLTKYAIAFLVAGLAVAVLVSPLRRDLRTRWPWIGAAIATILAMPNLIWEARHGWITLEFLRFIHERDVRIGRTSSFLPDQLTECANLVTVPLWLGGLAALLLSRRLRRFRPAVFLAIVPFALFVIARGRGYYAGPIYPMLLAAGAVMVGDWLAARRLVARRLAEAGIGVALLTGAAAALVILPLAPPGSHWFSIATSKNGDLVEEIGWPELVGEVARIWRTIPAAERAHTAIYCGNYGEAGAVNLYGPAWGLPPAISGINSFHARGYGASAPAQVIVVGAKRERLERLFRDVRLAGHTPNPLHVSNEETRDHPDIFLCRDLRGTWPELWPQVRSFG